VALLYQNETVIGSPIGYNCYKYIQQGNLEEVISWGPARMMSEVPFDDDLAGSMNDSVPAVTSGQ